MSDCLVVDTDVVSFLFKGDSRAGLYNRHLRARRLVVSFMTVAELYRWAEEKNWGQRRKEDLEAHIRKFAVSPASPEICRIWASVMADGTKNGRKIGGSDAWIAATAIAYRIPLVSHNGKDYSGVNGLTVICESEPVLRNLND